MILLTYAPMFDDGTIAGAEEIVVEHVEQLLPTLRDELAKLRSGHYTAAARQMQPDDTSKCDGIDLTLALVDEQPLDPPQRNA